MFIIFGATGFIGLYTAEHFVKNGYQVIGTGRNKQTARLLEKIGAEFIELDVTNKEDFRKLPTQGVDGVIVLTGLLPANAKVNLDVDENAADYFSVNVIGTINILEYCRKNGIKKVIGNTSYSDVSGAWGKKYPNKMKNYSSEEKRRMLLNDINVEELLKKNEKMREELEKLKDMI